MLTLRSETNGGAWPRGREPEPCPPFDRSAGFIAALFWDGDSRIAADPHTGLNKYFCPTVPAPDLVCASSCTASPVSVQGFDTAPEAFSNIVLAPSPRQRANRLAALTARIEGRLLRYFGASTLARAFLRPSGTDALLTTAMLVAAERPDEVMTAILPSASKTGTGYRRQSCGRFMSAWRTWVSCSANRSAWGCSVASTGGGNRTIAPPRRRSVAGVLDPSGLESTPDHPSQQRSTPTWHFQETLR
jgi:hypothetical protein